MTMMIEHSANDGLVTLAKAADRLGCSRATIYRLYKSGELELVKLGRRTKVTEKSLRKLLNQLQPAAIKKGALKDD